MGWATGGGCSQEALVLQGSDGDSVFLVQLSDTHAHAHAHARTDTGSTGVRPPARSGKISRAGIVVCGRAATEANDSDLPPSPRRGPYPE